MEIKGLSPEDTILLTLEEVKESITPSRCPSCGSTNVTDTSCKEGSVCGYDCGGGGFIVACGDCGITIHESECEEAEEE